MTESRSTAAHRKAVAALAVLALACQPCGAVPSGTTEYTNVQIANEEWSPETTFGNAKANLQIGVRANALNSFQDIGFGYVGNAAQHKPPAVIAYEQTSAAGETKGDLVFGTRGSTSGSTAAVEQVRIRSDGTVDVESVRFTGSQIGISGDPDMIDLGTTAGMVTVNGDLKATGDLTLTKPAAAITHSGGTSLSISSDGSGFVAVESVEFAGANIGISGDTNLMVLTSGVLTVDGKVASTTLETSGAATVATTLDVGGATNLTNTLDVSGATTLGSTVELLANAATVTHSGTTSLTISSTAGFVDVELVRFTDAKIGISGDPDMIDLGTTAGMVTVNGDLKATGDLTLTKPAAAITHSGGTSLSISSDGSGFVAVESVEFAGANIGISGDTNLMVLTSGVLTVDGKVASTTLETSGAATVATTLDVGGATNLTNTLDVSGATTLGSTVELLANAATVTHSGTTSLTISSTLGYVGVETVQFTGSQIGISGDPDMIDLGTTAGMVTVNGDLKATGDLTLTKPAAAITHSGGTSLSISSDGSGFVAVESVEFAGANIGISGDTNLMVLTSGVLTVDGKVASTTLETSGAATVATTLDVGGATNLTNTLDVSGATTLGSTVELLANAATVTHSGTTSLTISSTLGYVGVETVQFTGSQIGISGDPDMIDLGTTAGMVTVNGDLKATGDLTLTKPAAAITHSGGTSLSISSDGSGFVAVESVEFAGANIGISGDTNLMVLTSGVLTVDGKVVAHEFESTVAVTHGSTLDVAGATNLTNTLDVSGATTLGSTVELLANAATVTHSGTTSLTISSTAGFVDVELVRFTDAKIGISGDPDMIDLGTTAGMVTVNGDLKATGDLTLTKPAAAITHSGGTSLSISSEGSGFVDVELVRFTDAKIGISGDPDMIDLGTTAGMVTVNGDLKATGDLTLTKPAAAITHSGGTSLSISSDGSGFVAVESVEFAGANIGISGDTNLMVLTSGVLTVDGKVVAHEFESTVAVTHGSTLDVAGATNLTNTLDVSGATTLGSTVELLANAATVTHSGTTSLTISSTAGFVDVELVRFTDAKIGISGDPDMIDLGTTAGMVTVNGDLKATGDLTLTKPAAAITHSGGTSLSISSEGSGFVDVELVRFTDAKIGISGDPDMIDLGTTAGMVTVNGDLKATGDLTLTKPAAAITHSGGTSLSISSDGSGFVAVESVEFAGANIGISGDTNLMVLTSGVLTVDGKVVAHEFESTVAVTHGSTLDVAGATNLTNTLDVSGATTLGSTVELLANAATVTHSGTTSLTISSTAGFVDVELVRFTDAKIGISGDPDMIDLGTTAGMVTVNGDLKATGDLTLTKPAAAITHSGGTSLSISSEGSGFVDVELVRFTDAKIGISGDPDMIDLGTTAGMVTVNGDLKATGDLTLTKPAAAITHSGGTSLSISSDGSGFVAVESVEFAGANIGISGDTNLMVLTSGVLTVDGKVASTTLETSGAATVATTLDVGGATNLTNTLDVSGATTLGSTVELLANAATVTHSGTTSLTISSTLGYVGVETVQFTGSQIGISGDPDMIDLGTTAGMVTVNGDLKATGDLTLTKPAAAITHSGGTSLSISSDGSGFVAVESVEFAGANIGISGDTNLMVLTSGVLTVDGKVVAHEFESTVAVTHGSTLDVAGATNLTNTLDVSGATTLGSTVELLANAATVTHSGTTSLTISSTAGFVDVELVRFTDAKIGISGDPDMIDLGTTAGMVTVNGDLKATGDLTLTKPAAAITHSGGTSLSISSEGSGFVAVESVEFAGANIGISGDTNLMVLTSGVLTVDGKVVAHEFESTVAVTHGSTLDVAGATNLTNTLDVSGATTLGSTVELLANAATVTHSGTTSLTISSTAGFVDVELVRFTDAKIGISGDPDMIDLGTTAGMVTVNGDLKATGDLTLTKPAAAITHSGGTSLSISSDGSGFVAVESVEFAGANIGISGDTNLMVLTSGVLTVDGKVASTTLETSGAATVATTLDVGGATNLTNTLDVSGATTLGSTVELLANAATVTHSGTTSLTISSTLGYVGVETVQFTGSQIGISGDPDMIDLGTTAGMVTVNGDLKATGDLTLTKPAAAITHSGGTSLSISSDGSGFVAVESVEFAGANIGISGDTNLMVLTSGVLTVDGKVASTTLETSGAATVATTLDVGGATNLTNTLDVSGATTLGSTVELLANAATVTHSGTTSLTISSTLGYVGVETVQFTGSQIGISGDATMIDLGTTAGMVTVNGDLKATGDLTLTTAAAAITHSGGTSLSISSGGFVDVESVRFTDAKIGINGDATMIDLGTTAGMVTVNGDLKATGDLTLTTAAASITHSGGTSLSISSGGFVAVESVEFAGANIGISGDTNLMVLSSGVLTVDGKVVAHEFESTVAVTHGSTLDVAGATNLTNTLDVSGATTLGSTVELLANAATVTHSGTTSLTISSTLGYVGVETVQFTGSQIGISGDTTMIDLGTTAGMVTVNGNLKATGDLTLTKPAAAITHSGATSLSISSGGFVDVESVRFTDAKIGISGDATMIDLGTTAGMVTVNGDLKATGDLTLTTAAASITHSGGTSLSISSGGFVAVESVQFAGANIGINGDTNLMVLTSGVLTVDGKVASTTLETSGAATVATTLDVGGATNLTNTLDVSGATTLGSTVELLANAATVTHSGTTSLTISSTLGYVGVETVQFTGSQIGISGDTTMIDLGATAGMVTVNGNLKATGDLTLTKPAAAITHSGATSLSISSGGFVDVESVRFTDAKIGINGDATMIDLGTTAGMVTVNGDLKATGDLTLTTAAASITHSGGTSLSISSGGFVAVESVQFAGANIGINGDTNLMVLTSGVLTVDGKVASTTLETSGAATVATTLDVGGATNLTNTLDVSGATTLGSTVELLANAATVTHSGTTSLTISSTLGYVGVETVQFTGSQIGISGDTTMIDLGATAGMVTVNGNLKATGDLTLTKPAAAITHSGATSLSISSGGFVDVESVRFTDAKIGINGDATMIDLGTTAGMVTVNGNLKATGDLTLTKPAAAITHSGATSLSISSGGFVDVESVRFTDAKIGINGDATMIDLGTTAGMVTVNGNLKATGDLTLTTAAAAITHSGATSLSISSGGFVDVELVRFTDAKIGINGDATMIDLGTTAGMVTVNGNLKATGDLTLTTAAASITHSGGTSLSISSGGFVAVESVQFAGANIGINGDTNLMVLTSGVLTVDGKVASTTLETSGAATVATTLDVGGATNLTNTLDVSGATTLGSTVELLANAATVTHSGTTSLTISSTLGYVGVETVQFTGSQIGISGDTTMIDLGATAGMVTVNGNLKATGDLTLTKPAAAITHSGATSLSISSGGFVDVESVRFTDAKIGINGDATMIDLGTTAGMVTVNGNLKATGDLTLTKPAAAITHSGATSLSISSGGFVDVESVRFTDAKIGINGDATMIDLGTTAGMVTVNGDLKATGDLTLTTAAASITHSGATSLSISSGGFVAVESVEFAGANIGINGDPNLMVLTSGVLTVDGKVASTTLSTTGAATLGGLVAVGGAHSDATKELYVNGDVYATGTIVSASDARFKRNVKNVTDALDIARRVSGVTFSFRTEDFPERRFPSTPQTGVLAHELEAVLPDLVSKDDRGFKGVAYERLGVYALAAVKELDEEVRLLRAALDAVRATLERMSDT